MSPPSTHHHQHHSQHPNFVTSLGAPAEALLQAELPDYAAQQQQLSWILSLLMLGLVGLTIVLLKRNAAGTSQSKDRKGKNKKTGQQRNNDDSKIHWTTALTTIARVIQYGTLLLCVVLGVLSPWNHNARTVYQVPLLTETEAASLLDRAAVVAYQNYQSVMNQPPGATGGQHLHDPSGFTQEPLGWHKTRKEAYLTTDLKLATDPFTPEDRAWLAQKLHARLAPVVARIYGIAVASIRCNDLFLVRYDAGKRTRLRQHVDDVDISFNLLLSTNFTGGGTRFFNAWQQKLQPDDAPACFHHAQPQRAGTVLLHSSHIEHEGHPVATGTRFILAGFLSVDRVQHAWNDKNDNHNHRSPTGLSLFASWFHAQWVQIRFRNAHQQAKQQLQATSSTWPLVRTLTLWWSNLCAGVGALLLLAIDALSQHQAVELVAENDAEAFVRALDEEYEQRQEQHGQAQAQASWYRGQQLQLAMDGSIWSAWDTRRENEAHFQEL